MKIPTIALFALFAFNPMSSFADGGSKGGGGGVIAEGDLKHFIFKLDQYLYSADGKAAFPEIGEYDHLAEKNNLDPGKAHLDTIHEIAINIRPTLQKGAIADAFGVERDCVSYTTPFRHFICNSEILDHVADQIPDGKHSPSFFRIMFHEILVQAGLEKPVNKEVPSEYPIASRLDVHLETFEEWVPGTAKVNGHPYDCVVVYQTIFHNDDHYRIPFSYLASLLYGRGIKLVENFDPNLPLSSDVDLVITPDLNRIKYTKKIRVDELNLTLSDRKGSELSSTQVAIISKKIKTRWSHKDEQMQSQYQMQATSERTPFGYYLKAFIFSSDYRGYYIEQLHMKSGLPWRVNNNSEEIKMMRNSLDALVEQTSKACPHTWKGSFEN